MMLFKILRAVNFLELSARILCFFIVWIVNSLLLLNVLNGTQTDRQTHTQANAHNREDSGFQNLPLWHLSSDNSTLQDQNKYILLDEANISMIITL